MKKIIEEKFTCSGIKMEIWAEVDDFEEDILFSKCDMCENNPTYMVSITLSYCGMSETSYLRYCPRCFKKYMNKDVPKKNSGSKVLLDI